MHDFLKTLSHLRPGAASRYGWPILAVGLATLLRLVAPLDAAPFLLYLPIIVLMTLALGREAGLASFLSSTLAAAYFFVRGDLVWQLSTAEIIALVQFLIVGGAMVLICGSLRQAFVENEVTLANLDEANRFLRIHREHLETARQEAESARKAAEEANLAKSTFIANMSHELRTPLSAIIGYSEMMLEEIEETGDKAGLGADVQKIEGNARHLLGLINDVLDLSKVESGKMDVYVEEFDVEPMVEEVAATVGSLIGKKGNSLELRLAPGLGSVQSDLTKLRQILLNLLSNAAKFTEGGTVTLAASRRAVDGEADRVVFTVTDTGIGMTDEQLTKLFQRFQQADSSTTRKFGGTGLGLSLTKAFADMLGGHVSVESVAGRGSTFTLDIPSVHATSAQEEPSPDGSGAEDGNEEADLILVIEDDADQRNLTTRFLHREGFRVRMAVNGRAGLDLARKLRPRAILLDVMMPGIDGWSVLSQLKADPQLSAIPVVMVTAVDQRNLAASLGAADYMLKPVDWSRFGKVLERFRSPQTGTTGRVLLVEDDAVARLSMRSSLEDLGWSVAEASNGREGLERASQAAPTVVLMDLNMPVMDGFTFLTELRAIPGCAEVPVIILTARDLSREDRRLLRGASQILNRGDLSLTQLVDRLQGLAERSPS